MAVSVIQGGAETRVQDAGVGQSAQFLWQVRSFARKDAARPGQDITAVRHYSSSLVTSRQFGKGDARTNERVLSKLYGSRQLFRTGSGMVEGDGDFGA